MIARRPVTAAVKQLIEDLTGYPVGVRTVPMDPTTGAPVPPPYTLLYPLDHTSDDNTLADRHSAAMSEYQATFVSGKRPGASGSTGRDEEAQWLADRGRRVIERPADGSPGYEHPLTIPGVGCYRREAREAGGTQNAEDAIITSVIRFRFFLEETGA